jgi:hypothetical protein
VLAERAFPDLRESDSEHRITHQGPYAPLLNYTWMAAEFGRQARSLHIEWPPGQPDFTRADEVAKWVGGHVESALETFPVATPLLAGKSMGTYAAGIAADRRLPTI